MLICKKAVISGGETPHKLAMTAAIGIYIAFSPFPGLHGVLILLTRNLLGLNLPVLFVTASINNPWTMIPFYTLDYAFGYWFMHGLLGYESTWLISLERFFGSGTICLWSFVVGGNILGIVFALISYPVARHIFYKIASNKKVST